MRGESTRRDRAVGNVRAFVSHNVVALGRLLWSVPCIGALLDLLHVDHHQLTLKCLPPHEVTCLLK